MLRGADSTRITDPSAALRIDGAGRGILADRRRGRHRRDASALVVVLVPFQMLLDLVLRQPFGLATHPLGIVATAMAHPALGFILVLVVALPGEPGLDGEPHPGQRGGAQGQTAQGLRPRQRCGREPLDQIVESA
jgi:hypothetical protein